MASGSQPVEHYVLAAAWCAPGSPHRRYVIMASVHSSLSMFVTEHIPGIGELPLAYQIKRQLARELQALLEDDPLRITVRQATVQVAMPAPEGLLGEDRCRAFDAAVVKVIEAAYNRFAEKASPKQSPIKLRLMSDLDLPSCD